MGRRLILWVAIERPLLGEHLESCGEGVEDGQIMSKHGGAASSPCLQAEWLFPRLCFSFEAAGARCFAVQFKALPPGDPLCFGALSGSRTAGLHALLSLAAAGIGASAGIAVGRPSGTHGNLLL